MSNKITGGQAFNKFTPKALSIFNRGGIPLTACTSEEVLQGGLYAAITHYVNECFETELNQIKFGNNVIIFKRTEHLLGSVIIDNSDKIDPGIVEIGLNDLLKYIEKNCPEFKSEKYNSQKIENLVNQYMNNFS